MHSTALLACHCEKKYGTPSAPTFLTGAGTLVTVTVDITSQELLHNKEGGKPVVEEYTGASPFTREEGSGTLCITDLVLV